MNIKGRRRNCQQINIEHLNDPYRKPMTFKEKRSFKVAPLVLPNSGHTRVSENSLKRAGERRRHTSKLSVMSGVGLIENRRRSLDRVI
jgi:hypothetical protein